MSSVRRQVAPELEPARPRERRREEAEPLPEPEPPLRFGAEPEANVRGLASSDVATRAQVLRLLQGGSGNASVARLLSRRAPTPAPATSSSVQTITSIERFSLRTSIRRADVAAPDSASPQPRAATRSDAPPGEEEGTELLELFESLGEAGPAAAPAAAPGASGAAAPPSAAGGEPAGPEGAAAAPAAAEPAAAPPVGTTVSVPDIEVPLLEDVGKSDAVKGAFTYSASIERGGAEPRGFGVTRSFSGKLTGVTITHASTTFDVAATLEHPITYQVRTGTGPGGQKDIASAADGKITKTNYPTVHSDLTPDMSDLGGRPPRTAFWAEDLTLKHELVHAEDDKKNGPGAMSTVKAWLDTQTAADQPGVQVHLGKIPGRFAAALLAALSTEDGEKHAYGDGAPDYKARADKVKEKGDKGEYG